MNPELKWDVHLLKDEMYLKRYQTDLSIGTTALAASENMDNYDSTTPPTNLCSKVSKLLKQVAANTIPVQKEQLTPTRLAARNKYLDERARLMKNPADSKIQDKVQIAKQKLEELQQSHLDIECSKFFNGLLKLHPQRRTSMMYKYVKSFKRRVHKRNMPNIPISKWDDELKKCCTGTAVQVIPENDHSPVSPPPTINDIMNIIHKMHNGTSPGQDRINIELLKNGPPELIELIHVIICRAWCTNIIPAEWLTTTQIPLPKIPSPKEVDDYRRITPSVTIYKIYATLLLQRLQSSIDEIPLYQAGFLRNRSTEDHIFTLRRITEERWRKGLPTFVVSIDLKKAFDMLDIHRISDILLSYGTPAYLINRIITAILHERTNVQWSRRRTRIYSKYRGVKQGCPISPYLFVVIMHYAIQRACDKLGIDTNFGTLSLPIILAYADDIIILADSIQSADRIFQELETELQAIGLTVNESKSSVLLRDPTQAVMPLGETIRLGRKDIKVVNVSKYLGIYISSDLDRRSTVSHRIKMAYRNLHMFLPFFKMHRLSFDNLMMLYHTVIVPTVMYALKVATLTKRNRRSLRNMERYIVLKLRSLARDPPPSTEIITLLKGRTIDRKCRVQHLKYWGHILRRPATHVLRKAMAYHIPGKYKQGRPCFTWHDSLNRALRKSRIQDWQTTNNDKQLHNAKCNAVYDVSDTDVSE